MIDAVLGMNCGGFLDCFVLRGDKEDGIISWITSIKLDKWMLYNMSRGIMYVDSWRNNGC